MKRLSATLLIFLLILGLAGPASAGWDAAKPADTQKIRLGPADIRANNDALEDALAREHEFPGTEGTTAGRHAFGVGTTAERDAITSWRKGSIWFNTETADLQVQTAAAAPFTWSNASGIPSGTKAVFFQANCPAGWTQDTSNNDRLIRIVSGTGGGTGGDWTITGMNSAGQHNHDANHNHNLSTFRTDVRNDGDAWPWGEILNDGVNYTATANVTTTNNGSHAHSFDGTWRPAYQDCIVCTKD